MSFKIVQTKEPGAKGPLLSIVPSAWEKDGTLYWPPAKKKGLIFKIIKDGNSRPEPDWVPQPCTRKRQTFLSHEAADLELTAMEQKSDSEASQNLEFPKKRLGLLGKQTEIETEEQLPKKRLTIEKRTEIGRVPQADFNFLAEECKKATELIFGKETVDEHAEQESTERQIHILRQPMKKNENVPQARQILSQNRPKILQTIKVANQRNPLPSFDEKPAAPVQYYSNLLPSSQMMDYEENGEFACEVLEQNNVNEQIKLSIDNQNTIIQNQSTLLENQMRIMEQLANQETMIQLICQHLSSTKITASTTEVSDNATKSCDTPDPLPIDSLTKLEQFEMDLRDETYMNKLIKCESHICGTNGKMNGLNCSYRLIDCFFKRQLLVQFSWSGGSRNNEGKMAFKKYTNIMKTFYKIVSKADSQYTETECQNFFKSVIKNAKRRFELAENNTEKRRASSGKKRPHNLNYKIERESNNQEIHTPDAGGNIEEIEAAEGTEENEVTEEDEAGVIEEMPEN